MSIEETWTTLKLLAWTQDYLKNKGVENARREAEWLLCAVTGLDRVGLYLDFEKPLMPHELSKYRTFVVRRGKREPLQHILGTEEFYGREFVVSPEVLIPRHDTEILVEEALKRKPDAKRIVDMGTGSGCLAVTLSLQLPSACVEAVDISTQALEIARYNAQRLQATVAFHHGSWFEPLQGRLFDLIVSNPPYIPSIDIEGLQPEVRDHDPRIALDGGLDGLEIYATLIPEAIKHLQGGGWLLLEIGAGQADDVTEMFKNYYEYTKPITVRDYSGIIRVVGAERR